MSTTLGKGPLRRAGLLAATSAICWVGFAGISGAAYASPADHSAAQGNSAAAHDNGHGNDDTKKVATSSAPTTNGSDHSTGTAGTSGDPSQPQPPSNADQNPGGANGQCPGGPYCSTRDGSPSGNGNGNGNGKATGKPCAGCVGKADNKNPKGQMPNGSDHNNGYECDGNNGIGKTNPAHTGCQSSPPPTCEDTHSCPPPPCEETHSCPPSGCPEGQVMDDNGDCTTPGCPAGQVMDDNGDCTTPGCPEGQVMGDKGDCTTPGCPEGQGMGDNGDCTAPGGPAGTVMDENGDCTPTPDCVPTAANKFCSTVQGEHHTRKPPTKVLGEKVTRTPTVLPFTGAAGIGVMIGTAGLAMVVGGGLMVASRRRRGQAG